MFNVLLLCLTEEPDMADVIKDKFQLNAKNGDVHGALEICRRIAMFKSCSINLL